MSETKISSDEVPAKFAEWLLFMGCPVEKVPTVDKITEICRGQYFMVWRNLMERTAPKDEIRRKRLQVFCNDVHKCQASTGFGQQDPSALVPEELRLWQKQQDLQHKVNGARTKLAQDRKNLDVLLVKVGDKMAQRNIARKNVENAQRRAYLLQSLADELNTKRSSLKETVDIANSICGSVENSSNIQQKLDKYLSSEPRLPDPIASSSVASGTGDSLVSEDHLSPLLQCPGNALCTEVYTRRANLLRVLAVTQHARDQDQRNGKSETPQSVLAHTAALHCTLALEATKNKIHFKQAHNRLVNAVTELNTTLSGESCELLVLRCEKAHSEARVKALKLLMDELVGLHSVYNAGCDRGVNSIATVDRAIEQKRDELKKVMSALASTERKIQSVKECLTHVFQWIASDSEHTARYRGIQLDLPQESMVSLRQFYETRRQAAKHKVDISLELDASEGSFNNTTENPRFPDELKIYLSQFNLEKNSQLVLESGDKIWLSETLASSIHRLHSKWLTDELSISLLNPGDSLANNLKALADRINRKAELEAMLIGVPCMKVPHIDITRETNQEAQAIDKVKKRLKENLDLVLKTNKTIALCQENVNFWSENKLRKYISIERTVNGLTYRDYERWYLDNLGFETT